MTKVYYYTDSSSGIASLNDSTAALAATSYVRYLYSTTTVTHNYVTQNGKVVRETIGSGRTGKVLDFIYDESGRPFALIYTNGTADPVTYYYVLNLQGDVVGLIDETGAYAAKYTYNAWGEVLSVTNASGTAITSSTHIANLNPLRYRGYYYDTETGFYYLQSRYYDPVTHRFINADSYASTGQGIVGTNMFAYCLNNPVMYADHDGEDVEITIVTVEFNIQTADGTLHVKCSLKRTIAEDSNVRYLYEPGNIEYEFSGGPMSVVLTDTMGNLEVDYSVEVAKYENEKGSISLAFSLKGGASVTMTEKLKNGYFWETTFSFTRKNKNGPASPVFQTHEETSLGRATGQLFVGTLTVATVHSIYDYLSDLLDGDKGGANDPMYVYQ